MVPPIATLVSAAPIVAKHGTLPGPQATLAKAFATLSSPKGFTNSGSNPITSGWPNVNPSAREFMVAVPLVPFEVNVVDAAASPLTYWLLVVLIEPRPALPLL